MTNDDAPDSERTQRADHLMEMAKDERVRTQPDPFKPPPGAQQWLAASFMFWIQPSAPRTQVPGAAEQRGDRAFGLLGCLMGQAQLTPAQRAELDQWLFPEPAP